MCLLVGSYSSTWSSVRAPLYVASHFRVAMRNPGPVSQEETWLVLIQCTWHTAPHQSLVRLEKPLRLNNACQICKWQQRFWWCAQSTIKKKHHNELHAFYLSKVYANWVGLQTTTWCTFLLQNLLLHTVRYVLFFLSFRMLIFITELIIISHFMAFQQ